MKLDIWTKAKAPPKVGHNPPPSKEERIFILMMNDIFKRQVADAVRNVKKVLGGDRVELVDRSRWIPEIAELTEGLRFVPFKRGGDEAIADLYKVRKQFGLTEWIEDPTVLRAVKEESFMFARTISDKTANDLQVAMMKGVKAGESITQIERRVVAVNEAWRDSKRSMMIARTETSRAYTQGQIAAWEQTGVVTEKVWSAASDSCPFCAAMNGKVVGLKEDYLHNGDVLSVSAGGDRTASLRMGYGNVNGPPLHPNCRCSIVAHVVAGRDVGVTDVIQVVKPATRARPIAPVKLPPGLKPIRPPSEALSYEEIGTIKRTADAMSVMEEFEKSRIAGDLGSMFVGSIISQKDVARIIMRTRTRKIVGAVSYLTEPADKQLLLDALGAIRGAPKGTGAEAVRIIANKAGLKGYGIKIQATPDSAGFYKRLGFKEGTSKLEFVASPERVREIQLAYKLGKELPVPKPI